MTGDRTESKSVNTSSQSGKRQTVWQTLRFVLQKKAYHIQMLDMLEQFLQPQLFADNILDLMVFQQDGALPHFAHSVRNYLNETFPGRWIGRGSPRFWTAPSRDLMPLDFFAWGHIKTQVNKVKIRDLQHLRERISAAVHTIPQQCCSVCSGAPRRDGNSAQVWRAIMSNGSDCIKLRCLLPHYKHFI